VYKVFRRLVNDELPLVRSYAELEEVKRLVALFNECCPGEYCIREAGSDADAEIIDA
jgi:hypothetical protein